MFWSVLYNIFLFVKFKVKKTYLINKLHICLFNLHLFCLDPCFNYESFRLCGNLLTKASVLYDKKLQPLKLFSLLIYNEV